jgi:hypothetical protein
MGLVFVMFKKAASEILVPLLRPLDSDGNTQTNQINPLAQARFGNRL